MTLCILGAGAFGSAIAITLAKSSGAIILWSRTQKFAEELQKTDMSSINYKSEINSEDKEQINKIFKSIFKK